MTLSLIAANLATLAIGSLFYGMYLVLFFISMYLLLQQHQATHTSHKSRNDNSIFKSMVFISAILLCLVVTLHWTKIVYRAFVALEHGAEAEILFNDHTHSTEIIRNGLMGVAILIGDSLIVGVNMSSKISTALTTYKIHRLWVVWDSKLVIVVPVACLASLTDRRIVRGSGGWGGGVLDRGDLPPPYLKSHQRATGSWRYSDARSVPRTLLTWPSTAPRMSNPEAQALLRNSQPTQNFVATAREQLDALRTQVASLNARMSDLWARMTLLVAEASALHAQQHHDMAASFQARLIAIKNEASALLEQARVTEEENLSLEEKIRALDQKISAHNSVSPAVRTPPEILCEIFRRTSPHECMRKVVYQRVAIAPWWLTHICRPGELQLVAMDLLVPRHHSIYAGVSPRISRYFHWAPQLREALLPRLPTFFLPWHQLTRLRVESNPEHLLETLPKLHGIVHCDIRVVDSIPSPSGSNVVLPHLKQLVLNDGSFLHCLKTPKLESLEVHWSDDSVPQFFRGSQCPLNTMKLHCSSCYPALDAFHELLRHVPNLLHLELDFRIDGDAASEEEQALIPQYFHAMKAAGSSTPLCPKLTSMEVVFPNCGTPQEAVATGYESLCEMVESRWNLPTHTRSLMHVDIDLVDVVSTLVRQRFDAMRRAGLDVNKVFTWDDDEDDEDEEIQSDSSA
ncbi:hypothetical protein B0H13DRAFT_2297197 [Mycena leptocephala]|nr:hypothetical protein B0H13DRAFT_2297197 [Mycena leptocephala]